MPEPLMNDSVSRPPRPDTDRKPHSAHWGVFSAAWKKGALEVLPHPGDPDPNPLIQNFTNALDHTVRVKAPMVRRGWLERGPGPDAARGRDGYVQVSWEHALDLLAALSQHSDISVGCYCEDEAHCHRTALRELLVARGATLAA
ncbi:hypothetical protein G6F22_017573 [Rhizopus arrhizus]|nr:hypothetical protein G6F22_017573 [Rhizopus arrhizus]